jgi:lysozyme
VTSSTSETSKYALPVKGVELIKQFEGCELSAYPDPRTGGSPITIGWGSTRDFNGNPFKLGQKISQKVADDLLISQIKKEYIPTLTKIPYWGEMNENQRGALLSFAYNLGLTFLTVLGLTRSQEYSKITSGMMYQKF